MSRETKCGHCARVSTRDDLRNLRPWPGMPLEIGECPTPGCKQTLAFGTPYSPEMFRDESLGWFERWNHGA